MGISGLVTFIAAYHYFRIFNSWVEAYSYSTEGGPNLTGVPFNDAYRYMDWLLTVPLLLIEILLVMKLSDEEYSSKAKTLGIGSALMIASGYYGELTITGAPLRSQRCHQQGGGPEHQGEHFGCAGLDCDRLVHIPSGLFVPHAEHRWLQGGGRRSARLHRV